VRVFIPPSAGKPSKPAVVMVCGLLWLGEGLLGRIGLTFNDGFGYAFAASGAPCVQIHTPCRHIAHTRMMDFAVLLLWPLSLLHPVLRAVLFLADALLLAASPVDLLALLFLVPLASWPRIGGLALPACHLLLRAVQGLRGALPGPKHRDHQREIAAAVAWAQGNQKLLNSDGRLVLCGYSSGGHCASMYALSSKAPRFEAVVLISGIYGLRTDTWSGFRRLLAPVFNMLYADCLGVHTPEERESSSPEVLAKSELNGQDWYVLTAQMELMGLQPFEDILFQPKTLCNSLTAKGAKVHRVTCGLNHWLLVLKIGDFVRPFCEKL